NKKKICYVIFCNVENYNFMCIIGPKRQPLQHSPSPFSSNTFPLRSSPKPSPKSTFSGSNTLPITDSSSTVGQLPYPYKQGNMNRSLSEGVCNGRPPVPIPGNSITQPTPPENEVPV
ncbi:hypothetical protein FKM82_020665, partial [Ascaphus truei]